MSNHKINKMSKWVYFSIPIICLCIICCVCCVQAFLVSARTGDSVSLAIESTAARALGVRVNVAQLEAQRTIVSAEINTYQPNAAATVTPPTTTPQSLNRTSPPSARSAKLFTPSTQFIT